MEDSLFSLHPATHDTQGTGDNCGKFLCRHISLTTPRSQVALYNRYEGLQVEPTASSGKIKTIFCKVRFWESCLLNTWKVTFRQLGFDFSSRKTALAAIHLQLWIAIWLYCRSPPADVNSLPFLPNLFCNYFWSCLTVFRSTSRQQGQQQYTCCSVWTLPPPRFSARWLWGYWAESLQEILQTLVRSSCLDSSLSFYV